MNHWSEINDKLHKIEEQKQNMNQDQVLLLELINSGFSAEEAVKGIQLSTVKNTQEPMAWRDKKIRKWTNKDLCNWIKSVGLSDKWEDTMIQAVENTGCIGQDWLAIKNGKDLANSFDVKQPMLANRVYREFKKIKKKKIKVGYGSYVHAWQPPNENEHKEFESQFFGQEKKIKNWSNKDLCEWIKTIRLSENNQDLMVKAIQNKQCSGKDFLAFKSIKDTAIYFGIEDYLARTVYTSFQTQVRIERQKEETTLEYQNYLPPSISEDVEEKGYKQYEPKRFYKWTTQDLCNWLDPITQLEIGFSSTTKTKLKQIFRSKRSRGYDWMKFESYEDVMKELSVEQSVAKILYYQFRIIWYKDKVPGGFEFQLFGQSKYWKLRQEANREMTIRHVKELYKAESGVGTDIDDIVLIAKAKVLPDHATLCSCGITDKRHLITVKFKAHGGCFVNGTKILKSNTTSVDIENINVGDIILTYNLNMHKLESYPVKMVLKYLVNILVKIKLSNDTEIVCTPSHPFYVPKKQSWCCIQKNAYDVYGELRVGDEVIDNKSNLVTIESIKYENIDSVDDDLIVVRTFAIDGGNHNYFANGILVHNKMGQTGVDVEESKTDQTGDNPYHFHQVLPGMNYGGICNTKACKANGQPVCHPRGFDETGFNPISENVEEVPKCPGCKQPFDLKRYYLYQCDVKIMFIKKNEKKKKLTYKPRGEDYVILGLDENGDLSPDAEYTYLKIWVYKPNTL
eukprot:292250_1